MSKRSVALGAGRVRTNSGKSMSNRMFGGAAVACLMIGCGWVVYSNIIAASVYPTLGSAGYDEPVVKRPTVASRSITEVVNEAFAMLPAPAKPVTTAAITPEAFNARFAAAEPQSVASNAASAAPAPAAPRVAEAPKPSASMRLAEAKPAEPKAIEMKPADKAKPAQAPQQLAL